MSDRGAENVFRRVRWPQTDGKPVCPLQLGPDLLRLDVRVEQPHRRIEMPEVGSMLHKLLLKLTHYCGQFCPLVA